MKPHPHFLWKDIFRKSSNARPSIADVLRKNILFRDLTPKELRYVSKFVYERTYQKDESIYHQGDRGIGMYIIASGKVGVQTDGPDGLRYVTTLEAGSLMGEVALVDPERIRSSTAVALEPTVLIGLFKPDLMQVIERKPTVGVKILFQLSAALGRRLIETTEKITQMKQEREGNLRNAG